MSMMALMMRMMMMSLDAEENDAVVMKTEGHRIHLDMLHGRWRRGYQ